MKDLLIIVIEYIGKKTSPTIFKYEDINLAEVDFKKYISGKCFLCNIAINRVTLFKRIDDKHFKEISSFRYSK